MEKETNETLKDDVSSSNSNTKPQGKEKSKGKPTKVMGVEFAPMDLPWERRMQTVAVVVWFVIFFIQAFVGYPILFYIIVFTRLRILGLLYLAWIFYDKKTCNKGGRSLGFVRRFWLWNYYRDYFPTKLVKTVDLDPKRNYLLGYHPHGILCSGAFSCITTDAHKIAEVFPGLSWHVLTLEVNFMIPFLRELALSLGTCAATRSGMNYLLSHPGGGKAAVLVPGGAPESLESHPGSYIIQLKKRKGFIKVALQNGSPLVPVFAFGETDIYDQVPNPRGSVLRNIQDKLTQMIQYAPPIFAGRGIFQYSFGLLPNRRPITVVVGAPIEVEKTSQPTQEQIDTLHEQYVDALVDLFYAHRDKYAADPSNVIRIV